MAGQKKITVNDEDILEEALLHYKHPSFDLDPSTPVRVSLKGQPAVDTGESHASFLIMFFGLSSGKVHCSFLWVIKSGFVLRIAL